MKNLKLFSTLILLFLLSIITASANFEVSGIKLGSTSQERGINTSVTATITNTGSLTIQNVDVTFPGADSDYKLSDSLSATTIAPGASITMTVTGYVPFDLDAVDNDGKKISIDIGDALIKGTYTNGTLVQKTANVLMEAENKLRLGTKKIKINDNSQKTLSDKTYEVRRDDDIELEVEVENRFDDDGDCEDEGQDCDIEDIDLELSADSDLDIDDTYGYDTISAGDSDTETIKFSIPDDIDDGKYDVDMFITGDDENGARHGDNMQFTLDVEVPRDEISITSSDLNPETVDCNDKKITLTVKIKNTGTDDQEDVSIWVDSPKLDIKDSAYNLELDEEDTMTKTFEFDLPSKLAAGQYFIQIRSNINDDEESDKETATLLVKACGTVTPPKDDDSDGIGTGGDDSGTDVNIIEVPPTAGVIYGKAKEKSVFESTQYIMLIGALVFIALMLFLILLVVLLKK